ncbi:MAG: DUF1772 domain-containing protein [Balneolaceae bacterium]|nr:DUF1772 domain-containing protein [Balneolaceae bacterium]
MLFTLTFIAAIGSALMAGLFFAFSNFVMQALGQLPPANGISAMQAINKTVQNALFFLVFMGTAAISLFLILNAIIQWVPCQPTRFLFGGLFYLTCSFLMTVFLHVPLNNRLEQANTHSEKSLNFWDVYLRRWTSWNHIRTLGSLAATVFYIMAMLTI